MTPKCVNWRLRVKAVDNLGQVPIMFGCQDSMATGMLLLYFLNMVRNYLPDMFGIVCLVTILIVRFVYEVTLQRPQMCQRRALIVITNKVSQRQGGA